MTTLENASAEESCQHVHAGHTISDCSRGKHLTLILGVMQSSLAVLVQPVECRGSEGRHGFVVDEGFVSIPQGASQAGTDGRPAGQL